MRIGVAVPTIGRWFETTRLLQDLAAQEIRPNRVVVASNATPPDEWLSEIRGSLAGSLDISFVHSPRGASAGRNTATREMLHDVDFTIFPNDNSRLAPGAIKTISSHVSRWTVQAWQMVDADGMRNTIPASSFELTKRSCWWPQEPATGIGIDLFMSLNGFDELIGTGSASYWQSGELADLLLRALEMKLVRTIEVVPGLVTRSATQFAGLSLDERRTKIRAYGRGTGYVYRKHHATLVDRARIIVAGAAIGIRKRHLYAPRDGLTMAVGRIEGLTGHVTRTGITTAVRR